MPQSAQFLQLYPGAGQLPRVVVPHGNYRESYPNVISRTEAHTRLKIPAESWVLGFFGRVLPYKNLVALIEAFRSADLPDTYLIIAGQPEDEAYARAVRRAAEGSTRVILELRHVPSAEVQIYLNAVDATAFPYRDILNSGSVLLSLSFGVRAACPALGSLLELQTHIGESWLHCYRGPFSLETLHEIVAWGRTPAPNEGPDLAALSWPKVAGSTLSFYREIARSAAIAVRPEEDDA